MKDMYNFARRFELAAKGLKQSSARASFILRYQRGRTANYSPKDAHSLHVLVGLDSALIYTQQPELLS